MSVQIEQDQDQYKIICQQCQHFVRVEKTIAEQYESDPESFHCELCYVAPGEVKHLLRKFDHCANCGQTFDSKSSCECPVPTSTISITYDPKGVWMKHNKVNEQQEMENTQREFNKIVRNRKIEQEERNKRIEELLTQNNELLRKILEKDNVRQK